MKKDNWRDVLVSESMKLDAAIKLLGETARRILIVVRKGNILQGTITDGDIRRAILKRSELSQAVSEVMNDEPVTAFDSEPDELIIQRLRKNDLLHIPIISKEREVVGLRTIQQLFEKEQIANSVVLMAGGFGSRLQPLTLDRPKPLLKVGDRPILETIMDQFVGMGFINFFISTHYKSDQIKKHFGSGERWGIKIHYIEEPEPLGTAGVLTLLPDDLPDIPIIVMNGDVLSNVDFLNMLQFHYSTKSDCTIAVKEMQRRLPYGVVETKDSQVTRIVEKPMHSHFINAGIYVYPRSLKTFNLLCPATRFSPFLASSIGFNSPFSSILLFNEMYFLAIF